MNASPARQLTPNQLARRPRILQAAKDLVGKLDYEGTIMRDVANAAGVSPTTLYNLYNTKDELLLEALREQVVEGWRRSEQEVAAIGFERLLSSIHHSIEQSREEPAYAQAIVQALFRASPGDQLIGVLVTGTQRGIAASLTAMQEHKELKSGINLDLLSRNMVGTYWAQLMSWCQGTLTLEQTEAELYRAFLCLLLPASIGSRKADIEARLAFYYP